jgi:hypothetical protein
MPPPHLLLLLLLGRGAPSTGESPGTPSACIPSPRFLSIASHRPVAALLRSQFSAGPCIAARFAEKRFFFHPPPPPHRKGCRSRFHTSRQCKQVSE